jgi:hypothetical protein
VQGAHPVAIQGIDDTCATDKQTLTPAPLDPGFLDRAHRFLRLWRATGYKMWELDLILGKSSPMEEAPFFLSILRSLQDATGLALDRVRAFFEDIDTATHRDPDGGTIPSLYARIFLNPTASVLGPDPDLAKLGSGELPSDDKLSDHLPGIQAALGLSAADTATLFALTDGKLTLANLSLIYRVSALAVAAKLSISDLLRVAKLLNPGASPAGSMRALFESFFHRGPTFLDQATAIRQSGLTLDALTYLLTPPASDSGEWPTTTQMTRADIAGALAAVQQAIVKLRLAGTTLAKPMAASDTVITVASGAGFPAPTFSINIGAEILLVTAVSVTRAGTATWTVVRGRQGTTVADIATGAPVTATGGDLDGAVVAAVAANGHRSTEAPVAHDVAALILKNLKVPESGTTLVAALEHPALVAPVAPWTAITIAGSPVAGDTLQAVLTHQAIGTVPVSYTLKPADNSLSKAAASFAEAINGSAAVTGDGAFLVPCVASGAVITLTAKHAAVLGIPIAVTSTNTTLPGGLNHVSIAPGTSVMSDLPAMTPAGFPEQFNALQLFDKIAVLVRGLRLVASDLSRLIANADVYGGLDVTKLPVKADQPALKLSPLLTTLLLIKLARAWKAAPPLSPVQTLYDVIGGVHGGTLATEKATHTALATITGWPLADIEALAKAMGLSFPADYKHPAAYDRLRILEAMAATAGTSGAQLARWGAVLADEPEAQRMGSEAWAALKARQPSEEAWLALAPKLMNPIRERRAAALQAWHLAQRDSSGQLMYKDADALFDRFLIDTQMSSCQLTSRVVQAYIAVQTFVERCLMNLEPLVLVDLTKDDTWNQWEWRKRYRIWEANREVFLYPENWLIESQRPNRSEIFRKLEQEVHQGQSTADHLETVVHNYIDRLDGLAHLVVTGTCSDPASGTIHVVARTPADPPAYHLRSCIDGAWSGWTEIPLGIKALHVIPAVYRGRVYLFWLDVKLLNEPQQKMPATVPTPGQAPPPLPPVNHYVGLVVHFSVLRDGRWAPAQACKGKLFDAYELVAKAVNDSRTAEALYTLKVQAAGANGAPVSPTGREATLYLEVFRQHLKDHTGLHVGRAVFDGRFTDLEMFPSGLSHALKAYGPDAQGLLPLVQLKPIDWTWYSSGPMDPQAGAWITPPADPNKGSPQTQPLPSMFIPYIPYRFVGPDTHLRFYHDVLDNYLFFQDNRRCYFSRYQPKQQPHHVFLNVFYHPFTRLFGNRLAAGGFDLLYDPSLQQNPESLDPANAFSFWFGYTPDINVVNDDGCFWDLDRVGTLAHDIDAGATSITVATNGGEIPAPFFVFVDAGSAPELMQVTAVSAATWTVQRGQPGTSAKSHHAGASIGIDRQFLDFSYGGAFSVYNWELFYHIPLYIAQLLSRNQQFEQAQSWLHYIFNPTRHGSDPVPQRFWITKPLHDLTSTQILDQQINKLLLAVNAGDPQAVKEIALWRKDPFNPFLLADLRPVAYMKSTIMSYLDNLIAWGDNLFSTDSREALSEATLLYVIASEILGPAPVAVKPPPHADASFADLQPKLDAFANAMVDIENLIGGAGGAGQGKTDGHGVPSPHTFYFKIPSNAKLLGYWATIADRLYKLRHCQDIAGAPLQLALFDAPIDPGLLIAAQAAGVDLSSVLSDLGAPLPHYRFTSLYPQALDIVNAVRTYGSALQAALEKTDAGALALLQQTTQQHLLADGSQILDWQVQQAQSNIDALEQTLALANSKYSFNNARPLAKPAEIAGTVLKESSSATKIIAAALAQVGAVLADLPTFYEGEAGIMGSPLLFFSDGGAQFAQAAHMQGVNLSTVADVLALYADLANTIGSWQQRKDNSDQAAAEARIQIEQAKIQIAGAKLALQIAQQNKTLQQEQVANIQKQIDFLNGKFTSDGLYDWMAGSLSATYFQSYRLAYQLCKQVERGYRFELGIQASSFIQFGYWDSLYKGLLAGETLNHDLRRMQASYLQQNARRYELSRYISLRLLDSAKLQDLLATGECDFTLAESLFDSDYPGHYNRRLTRVSLTVVYPDPGKFDNVKATLTLVANRVRITTDTGSGYAENPAGSDPRFLYNYAAVPQKISTGNAQDDPGLFVTAIAGNIADQRYLPFENSGAVSSWHLDMPQASNEVDLSTVSDVVLHLHYTAVDGGSEFQMAVADNNKKNLPKSGIKVFSAQNDFAAPSPTVANPNPLTPWQAFLTPPVKDADQVLTLSITPSQFPVWTRGKKISVTSLTVLAVAGPPGNFVLVPEAPLPTARVTMTPVAGVTQPNICTAMIAGPRDLGTWSFELQRQGAADFRSLTKSAIADVWLLMSYDAS